MRRNWIRNQPIRVWGPAASFTRQVKKQFIFSLNSSSEEWKCYKYFESLCWLKEITYSHALWNIRAAFLRTFLVLRWLRVLLAPWRKRRGCQVSANVKKFCVTQHCQVINNIPIEKCYVWTQYKRKVHYLWPSVFLLHKMLMNFYVV